MCHFGYKVQTKLRSGCIQIFLPVFTSPLHSRPKFMDPGLDPELQPSAKRQRQGPSGTSDPDTPSAKICIRGMDPGKAQECGCRWCCALGPAQCVVQNGDMWELENVQTPKAVRRSEMSASAREPTVVVCAYCDKKHATKECSSAFCRAQSRPAYCHYCGKNHLPRVNSLACNPAYLRTRSGEFIEVPGSRQMIFRNLD